MKKQNFATANIVCTYNSFVRKQKGITLIALVITIIVLLILARYNNRVVSGR